MTSLATSPLREFCEQRILHQSLVVMAPQSKLYLNAPLSSIRLSVQSLNFGHPWEYQEKTVRLEIPPPDSLASTA